MLKIPATISNFRTLSDKTIRIQVDTQELPVTQSSQLLSLFQKFGWMLFDENDVKKSDVPDEPAPEFKDEKSPSKRLRDCLYRWWEQNTAKKKPFDVVWKEWCDKKCEEIKETLN